MITGSSSLMSSLDGLTTPYPFIFHIRESVFDLTEFLLHVGKIFHRADQFIFLR